MTRTRVVAVDHWRECLYQALRYDDRYDRWVVLKSFASQEHARQFAEAVMQGTEPYEYGQRWAA